MAKMGKFKPAPKGLVSFVGVCCCSVSMFVSTCAAELQDIPNSADPAAQSTNQTPNSQQPAPNPQQQPTTQPGQKPVGTAAAESVPATGVAASQPAGTAIAPGKQRRTRSFVIKVGALIGAGVAIGTVAALSLGTSSKPPGAR